MDGWLTDGLGDHLTSIGRALMTGCRTLEDYHDIFDAGDLKHAPQIHEHEFNPFLLHDPKFQELHRYEAERGVERMRTFTWVPRCGVDQTDWLANRYFRLRPPHGHIRSSAFSKQLSAGESLRRAITASGRLYRRPATQLGVLLPWRHRRDDFDAR